MCVTRHAKSIINVMTTSATTIKLTNNSLHTYLRIHIHICMYLYLTYNNFKSSVLVDTNNNNKNSNCDCNEFDCDHSMKCHNYNCYYCISHKIPQTAYSLTYTLRTYTRMYMCTQLHIGLNAWHNNVNCRVSSTIIVTFCRIYHAKMLLLLSFGTHIRTYALSVSASA